MDENTSRSMKMSDYIIVAGVALAGCIPIFGSMLSGGRVIAGPDYFNYWFPLYENSLKVWREGGGIAIWFRLLHGGMPILASMNCMDLYPTQLIGIIAGISARQYFPWDATLHIVLSALGCSFMLSQMGVGRRGAILGGLFYAFSGLSITTLRFGLHPMIRAAALLPWMAVFLVRSFNCSKWECIWGGGVVSLLIFTNAIQMAVFGATWCLIITAFHSGSMKIGGRLIRLTAILGIGGLIGAVWLLPAFEYLPLSSRVHEATDFMSTESLEGIHLLELLIPGILGRAMGGNEYAGVVLSLYPGLLPMLFCFSE